MNRFLPSSSEQKAEQLWQNYAGNDEARFWKQYEKLVKGQKPKKVPAPTPATAPMPQRLSTQVYHNSFWRLGFWAFLANVLVVWVWMYSPVPNLVARFYWLMLAGFIIPWLKFAWDYHKFTLNAYAISVSKAGIPYDKLDWGEVKKVEYIVLNSKYYLKLTTHQRAYTFRVVISGKQRDELKTAIEYYINTPMPSRI